MRTCVLGTATPRVRSMTSSEIAAALTALERVSAADLLAHKSRFSALAQRIKTKASATAFDEGRAKKAREQELVGQAAAALALLGPLAAEGSRIGGWIARALSASEACRTRECCVALSLAESRVGLEVAAHRKIFYRIRRAPNVTLSVSVRSTPVAATRCAGSCGGLPAAVKFMITSTGFPSRPCRRSRTKERDNGSPSSVPTCKGSTRACGKSNLRNGNATARLITLHALKEALLRGPFLVDPAKRELWQCQDLSPRTANTTSENGARRYS